MVHINPSGEVVPHDYDQQSPGQAGTVYVLLGGGLDSTALVHYYSSRGERVIGYHFSYGQVSCPGEQRAVRAVADYYGLEVREAEMGIELVNVDGEFRSRNALLLLAAAGIIEDRQFRLSIGIHSGTTYYDCSTGFLRDIRRLVDGYFGGTVQIEAPFIDLSKRDIWKYSMEQKVPVGLTFSCERNGESPCGECPSCRDRVSLRETADI